MSKSSSVEQLVGKTLMSVRGKIGDDQILFIASDTQYRMFHRQDCCETVSVEDICGDIQDLVGSPILHAEESTSSKTEDWPEGVEKPNYCDSFTWTFYRIATIKGSVVIRWYGESNGYYSESVDMQEEELECDAN